MNSTTQNPVFYRYYRVIGDVTSEGHIQYDYSYPAVTIRFELEDGMVNATWAVCSPKDQFVKVRGREITDRRAQDPQGKKNLRFENLSDKFGEDISLFYQLTMMLQSYVTEKEEEQGELFPTSKQDRDIQILFKSLINVFIGNYHWDGMEDEEMDYWDEMAAYEGPDYSGFRGKLHKIKDWIVLKFLNTSEKMGVYSNMVVR